MKTEVKPIPFVRELCKDLPEAEILKAEDNFRRYLLLIKQICERLEQEECIAEKVDKLDGY